MYKAWELIKHLEEGGQVKCYDSDKFFKYDKAKEYMSNILAFPDDWSIVKPKKKQYGFLHRVSCRIYLFDCPKETENYKRVPKFDCEVDE